jgi:hypothetical protein
MNSSPSKVTQTTKQELTPEQKEMISSGMNLARPVMNAPPSLPGVPGFNQNQTEAMSGVVDSANSGALRDTTNKLGSAQNFLLGDVLDVNNNQGLQGAIQASLRPLEEQFTRVVKPGINHASIGTGPFSSYAGTKNTQANNLADNAYMRQVGDTTNKLVNDTYTANLDALTKGVAMAPTTQRAMLFPETAKGAVGDTQRQLQMQQGQQQFENQMMPFNMALQMFGAAGAIPGGGTTGTVTGAQPQSNPFMQLLGAAPAAAFAFL